MSFFPKSKFSKNKNYQVNLASLMGLCANNYLLLIKLLASNSLLNEQRNFFISEHLAYRITITEVTKYTSVIIFEQIGVKKNKGLKENIPVKSSLTPNMLIRLYHDAKVAEVISTQNVKQIKPRYDYPNNHMHQQNEKQQTNQFLYDWLRLCLALGQVKFNSSWGK